jgi:hypothetical protein
MMYGYLRQSEWTWQQSLVADGPFHMVGRSFTYCWGGGVDKEEGKERGEGERGGGERSEKG